MAGTTFLIICEILYIVITAAVHYKILIDNSLGYSIDGFLINFLWIAIFIELGIGFAPWIIIGIIIACYIPSKEEPTSSQYFLKLI